MEITEKSAVEEPLIKYFQSLGWNTHRIGEDSNPRDEGLGRETTAEVVLTKYLEPALRKLNPDLPEDALFNAIDELTRDRSTLTLVNANHQVYDLLKDGVQVTFKDTEGVQTTDKVKIVDWDNPENNQFLIVSQLTILGDMYTRRPDLIGFVNGIPLLLIELKSPLEPVKKAYDKNLSDYKKNIPKLFWYTGFQLVSNGSDTRLGTLTSPWEHFNHWKRVKDEDEPEKISLETTVEATCTPERFLDLLENYILFSEVKGEKRKILAKNHQYLGVENAFQSVQNKEAKDGSLGVFWHTQGSGKSFSMIFLAQKVFRNLPGNWTFVIVTDRIDLDNQIYKNFAGAGAVTESEEQIHAQGGAHLQRLLREDHRYVFTLIQKFNVPRGETYPVLSERDDIIVITDEAHRSQYDALAMNMRKALPNASFLGFTGTPLMSDEEKTREVFGDYVSIYNFKQSIDDHATVPLYYENRIPELEITNQHLNEEMENLLENAELSEEAEAKLEKEFSREYEIITRDDRLDTIARDIVEHFVNRGYKGKAYVVSIDRPTTIRTFEKVERYWTEYLAELYDEFKTADEVRKDDLRDLIEFMESTDKAVIITGGDEEHLRKQGIDITPYRDRAEREDLETKFKDPDDNLRLVFVCAKWITGFDVPSCSTIYLDKPMRNHTLMQTIARANRVYGEKENGLIVDYIGIFRNLQAALAIYAAPTRGDVGEMPVKSKTELVELLREAVDKADAFCEARGVNIESLYRAEGFDKIKSLENAIKHLIEIEDIDRFDDAVEEIIYNEELKREFLGLVNRISRLYKAIMPDPAAAEFAAKRTMYNILAWKIRQLGPEIDIEDVKKQMSDLLDKSVRVKEKKVAEPQTSLIPDQLVDLSELDFEKLRQKFKSAQRQRTELEKLKSIIQRKLRELIQYNHTRMNFLERYQELIEMYNQGSKGIEQLFDELVELAEDLNEEEKRYIKEQLENEEELAVFDLLTKPEPKKLTKKEEQQVKEVTHELLQRLKQEKLTLDWRNKQQTRAQVRVAIEKILDELPRIYTKQLYDEKCESVYQHVFESYQDSEQNVYAVGA